MTEAELKDLIPQIFERIHKKSALNFRYKFQPAVTDRKLILKLAAWFIKTYKPHDISPDLVVNFFTFQMHRYLDVQKYLGRKRVQFSWLAGPKAIAAWEQREITNKAKQTIKKDFKRRGLDLGLHSFKKAAQRVFSALPVLNINPTEEAEKQRYYNKQEGYFHCRDFTTLYNPVSNLCVLCKYKELCTKRLQIGYPLVYAKRFETDAAK